MMLLMMANRCHIKRFEFKIKEKVRTFNQKILKHILNTNLIQIIINKQGLELKRKLKF